MSMRTWPEPKYILPVMSWVMPPPREELNCMSAEKGWGCMAIWAAATCMRTRTVAVAMRMIWSLDFTRILLGR